MKRNEVEDVIACLPDGREVFYYYKDRFCVDRLLYEMDRINQPVLAIRDIKNSSQAGYLNKPLIKKIVAECGSGEIHREQLRCCWSEETIYAFVLGLCVWGNGKRGWDQTSRNESNLVLQLNFNKQHDVAYKSLVKPEGKEGPFEYRAHPISLGHRNSLAWVRLDFDLDTNEALIEEVQMDWLRYVARSLRCIDARRKHNSKIRLGDAWYGINTSYEKYMLYVKNVIEPYRAIWAEAALTAAIWFIKQELGISKIFYHSYKTGTEMKKVYGKPPKSIYTALPKRFGFKCTNETPEFIVRNKFAKRVLKKIKNPEWQVLQL